MNMPRFTAEASLYQTNNHYRFAASGSFLSDGNTTVTLQGCGWVKGAVCGGFITAGTGLCTLTCLTGGPALCAGCWAVALGAVYSSCKDCIPGWMKALIDAFDSGGGGGGGGVLCSRGGACGEVGDKPCCSGYYCAGGRCQKVGTVPQ